MKRLMILLPLFFAFAGAAHAQTGTLGATTLLNNVDGALNAFVPRFQASGTHFLSGEITRGFDTGNKALQGLIGGLTADTPLAVAGSSYVQTSNAVYAALLPTYQALDGPAMQLAALGQPLTQPLQQLINSPSFNLQLQFRALPGLAGLDTGGLGNVGSLLGDATLPGLGSN